MAVLDRELPTRRGRTQSPGTATPPAAVSRPWEAAFTDPADISLVRRMVGDHFRSRLYWIPGVVLAAVEKPEEMPEALSELKAALGDEGLSTGVLLLFFTPSSRQINLPRSQRAAGRIRVQTADEKLLNLHSPSSNRGGLIEQVACSTLESLGRESARWLDARAQSIGSR